MQPPQTAHLREGLDSPTQAPNQTYANREHFLPWGVRHNNPHSCRVWPLSAIQTSTLLVPYGLQWSLCRFICAFVRMTHFGLTHGGWGVGFATTSVYPNRSEFSREFKHT